MQSHGSRLSAPHGASSRCARPLPAGSDERGAGIRLRDDQAAARARPCDRRRGLHLSPCSDVWSAMVWSRPTGPRVTEGRCASTTGPRARAGWHSRWVCPNGELPAIPSTRCSLLSRSRCFMSSDFVEQCRQEWSRLGVPDALAEEMAAELAADLKEAEADGISAEGLLGDSASDPRSFAASWAAERGVIADSARRRKRPPQAARPRGVHRPCSDRADRHSADAVDRAAQGGTRLCPEQQGLIFKRHRRPLPYRPVPHRQVLSLGNPSAPIEWMLLLSSRSSRSASPHGCGRTGAARDHPASRPSH